LLPWFAFTI